MLTEAKVKAMKDEELLELYVSVCFTPLGKAGIRDSFSPTSDFEKYMLYRSEILHRMQK
jgi:hypothetical protein